MNEMNNPDIACIFNNIGKVYSNQGLHKKQSTVILKL